MFNIQKKSTQKAKSRPTNGLLKNTIKNIKPGVSVGSGWETANLDVNNDGIVNEADLGD